MTSSGFTSGGTPAGIKGCIADLYYLSLVDAPVRRLVLTNPQSYEILFTNAGRALPEGVDVWLLRSLRSCR
jgi:hypothetical protein